MLEVGAGALGLEGGPEVEFLDLVSLRLGSIGSGGGGIGEGGTYQHAGRLPRPRREAVRVDGELLLHSLDDVRVLKHHDRARRGAEHAHLLARGLELFGGHDGLEGVGGDVPQLLVVGAEEEDGAVGLRVEGRGGVLDGVGDDLLDASGGEGVREGLGEGVVGAAVRQGFEEGGGHFGDCFSVLVGGLGVGCRCLVMSVYEVFENERDEGRGRRRRYI